MVFDDYPHRRFNPLTGEWVLVSPHRMRRPWRGHEETPDRTAPPAYDPECYLCPGNRRAGGVLNPDYDGVFVFDNDFAALLPDAPPVSSEPDDLLRAEPEPGVCRVICYSPRHDLSMARLGVERAAAVVECWRDQYLELGSRPSIGYVQIFENRGAVMGCSNPHPHGQIWATASVPMYPALEDARQRAHLAGRDECLLCRYLRRELEEGERIVLENEHFVALTPFWAVWPFETMLLPRRHAASLADLSPAERRSLAEAMVRLNIRYDNLFEMSFPFSMGVHQQPTDGADHPHWHFHLHYYPPLLRSRSVKKFMVGFEMLAMPQRDLTPEAAAARLRALSEIHYLGDA